MIPRPSAFGFPTQRSSEFGARMMRLSQAPGVVLSLFLSIARYRRVRKLFLAAVFRKHTSTPYSLAPARSKMASGAVVGFDHGEISPIKSAVNSKKATNHPSVAATFLSNTAKVTLITAKTKPIKKIHSMRLIYSFPRGLSRVSTVSTILSRLPMPQAMFRLLCHGAFIAAISWLVAVQLSDHPAPTVVAQIEQRRGAEEENFIHHPSSPSVAKSDPPLPVTPWAWRRSTGRGHILYPGHNCA